MNALLQSWKVPYAKVGDDVEILLHDDLGQYRLIVRIIVKKGERFLGAITETQVLAPCLAEDGQTLKPWSVVTKTLARMQERAPTGVLLFGAENIYKHHPWD